MTIGIGILCDARKSVFGESVLLGVDKRSTQERSADGSLDLRIDDAVKMFPLPHGVYAICAGNTESQSVMLSLIDRLRQIESGSLTWKRLENAIIDVKQEVIKARHTQGGNLNAQMIFGSYLHGEPFLWRFLGERPLEIDLSPGHFVIGSSPGPAHNILWTKRRQTQKMTLQRSLLHCYEAIKDVAALDEKMGRFIGPAADFLALSGQSFVIPADCPLLPEWYERFKEDSAPLDDAEYRKSLMEYAKPLHH